MKLNLIFNTVSKRSYQAAKRGNQEKFFKKMNLNRLNKNILNTEKVTGLLQYFAIT